MSSDGIFTLPSIVATVDAAFAGPGSDLNNANNIGATFTFYVDLSADWCS